MSGMSPDDEAKERAYHALNMILKGNTEEVYRANVVKELNAIFAHALKLDDIPLLESIKKLIHDVMGLNLGSSDLRMQIETIKSRIYELQTY